jgi:hypothetical protein
MRGLSTADADECFTAAPHAVINISNDRRLKKVVIL